MAKWTKTTPAKAHPTKGKGAIPGSITQRNTTAKATALAVSKPMNGLAQTWDQGLPRTQQLAADMLQQLSAIAALEDLTDPQKYTLHDYVNKTFINDNAAIKAVADIIRGRALAAMQAAPTEVTPNGTIKVKYITLTGAMAVKEARNQKSGLDPKLVEAQLRARSLSVQTYMQEQVKFGIIDSDLAKATNTKTTEQRLLDDGVFTYDELQTLKHKPQLAVYPSKMVSDE